MVSLDKRLRVIKKLEKNKTIWGYNVVDDDEKLGLKRYQILVKKSRIPVLDKIMEVKG